MKPIEALVTPVSSIIDMDDIGLVESAKTQLRTLSLADFVLLSDNFTKSEYLHQIGEVKLEQISQAIKGSDEYKVVGRII